MKLVLDVWYELWEKTGSEDDTNPNLEPNEHDGHYPWLEHYSPWIGGKETRPEATFGERVS